MRLYFLLGLVLISANVEAQFFVPGSASPNSDISPVFIGAGTRGIF
jgi:hypothetical protein